MVGLNLVKTLVVPEVGEQLGLSVNLACLPLLNKLFSGLDKASKCRFPASRGVYELVLDEACVELKTFAV